MEALSKMELSPLMQLSMQLRTRSAPDYNQLKLQNPATHECSPLVATMAANNQIVVYRLVLLRFPDKVGGALCQLDDHLTSVLFFFRDKLLYWCCHVNSASRDYGQVLIFK